MENKYKIQLPIGTYVWGESDVKSLFNLSDINDIHKDEFKNNGITATKISKEEVTDYWKHQESIRIEHEQKCTCSDCGCSGKQQNMEWGDKGYVCKSCWDERGRAALRM